jgi:hypothetical protein
MFMACWGKGYVAAPWLFAGNFDKHLFLRFVLENGRTF